jgi:hypothetical protein
MPRQKNDSGPSPLKPITAEPTIDAAEATISRHAAAAESQSAPTPSDRLENTATSPVMQDAYGNPDMSETTDHNPSPADSRIAGPTSPEDGTFEARATNDESGPERKVPATPSNTPENNLLLTAEGHVKQTAELDDGGCFEPFIPQVSISSAPKPAPKPKPSSWTALLDKMHRDIAIDSTPAVTTSEPGLPALAAAECAGDAEGANPSKFLPAPVEAPLPRHRVATAVELFEWIKRSFLKQTHLLVDAAELITFWAISTWFQDALAVLPCLAITGPAHDATEVLRILQGFCWRPLLVSDFRKGDLVTLRQSCRTVLISEPNLNTRSAALLGNLTSRGFRVVADGCATDFSMSRAIYLGEHPATQNILNSIHIHISPTNAAPTAPPQWLRKMIERIPVHLDQYRNKNLSHVHHRTCIPYGVSPQTAAIATPLGQGIVDAPELLHKLVALLKTQDQRRLNEMSSTREAVVVEATWAFIRDGRGHAYAREIAAKANRLRESRGETARLRAENVGHSLKSLGLPTHRISQTGNGLTFDRATVARIQQLTEMYMMEDTPAETENLPSSQTTETN